MNRRDIKLQAKGLVRTGQPKPVIVTIVFLAIITLINIISYKLVGESLDAIVQQSTVTVNNAAESWSGITSFYSYLDYDALIHGLQTSGPSAAAYLLSLLLFIMTTILNSGFVIFTLRTIDNNGASFWNLFDSFAMFFRIIWLYILESIFVYLWTLLFIIPGIIAMYRYRQAIYLLLEHPEMSALECIRESKRLMKGHKWELFVFDLSFIGWLLLIGILDGIGSSFGISIISVIGLGTFLNFWVFPYREISYAIYYRRLVAADTASYGDSWTPEF